MSGAKRLVLDQDDFLDDDGDEKNNAAGGGKKTSGNGGNQQTISISGGAGALHGGASPGKKTVDELAAEADAHRKSLIGIAGDGRGFTVDDLAQLSSVTLSKRHAFTNAEYEQGADPKVYQDLSKFLFEQQQQKEREQQQKGAEGGEKK